MSDIKGHPFFTVMEAFADKNPALRAKLDELKAKIDQQQSVTYGRMDRAEKTIKAAVDVLCEDGSIRDIDILYALTTNLVLAAYIFQHGDRAKARDFIAGGVDACMSDIDEEARQSGLHAALKEHEAVLATGDEAAIKRVEANISTRRF